MLASTTRSRTMGSLSLSPLALALVLSVSLVDNVLCYPDPDATVNCSSTGYPAVPCAAPANTVTLDLSHNHMEKIPAGCFPNLPKLKRLLLQFNRISTVDPKAFQHNPVLEYLDISHNLLPQISALPFTSLPALTHLDISNNTYEDILLEQPFDPQGHLQSLKLGSSRSVSISKDHVKRLGELQRLKELHLIAGEINMYEPGSLSVLKNLDMLTVDLQYMQDLKQFLILILDIRMSTKVLRIMNLDLWNRTLIPLPFHRQQTNISQLIVKNVKVDGSFCSNFPYFQKSLPEEAALENIHSKNICIFHIGPFDQCHLRKLSVKNLDDKHFLSFVGQPTLEKFIKCFLELSVVNIGDTFFPCQMSVGMAKLKKLNVSINELNDWRLFSECVKPFPALQSLAIDHNEFEHLGVLGNKTSHMKDLVNFTASYNQIHLEPQTVFINWTKSLRRLNLRSNLLTDEAFQFLPKTLEVLDVSYNNIQSVPVLKAMRDLQELFLSGNKIMTIDNVQLPPSVHLLHVDRNNMRSISVATIRSLNLTELDFSGNPLHCDCNTLQLVQFCRDSFQTKILGWPSRYQCQSPDSLRNETLEQLSFSWVSCHEGTFAVIVVGSLCLLIACCWLVKKIRIQMPHVTRDASYGSILEHRT